MSSFSVFEHSYYIGSYISAILYGFEIVMYCATLHNFVQKKTRRGSDVFFAVYSTILLIAVTLELSCDAVWGEQMWITFRDSPGGPMAFFATQENVWYQIVSSVAVVVLIFMGDALLIYRLFVLWSADYRVIVVPVLVYLTGFSLAIVQLVGSFKPGGNFFGGRAVVFGTTYYGLSIGLNIILTLLICVRLLHLSRRARATLGDEDARLYTGLIVLMVESAAPYALVGIMFLVPYARGSLTATAFGKVYAKVACLSPQLIVLRIMQGRAWKRETVTTIANSATNGKGDASSSSPSEWKDSRTAATLDEKSV